MTRTTALRWLTIIMALAWLFIVTFSYYIVHKPFSGENAIALFNALANVFIVVLIYALAAGIGHRLTPASAFVSPLEAMVFHIGIGLGVIALVTFALGLAGLINRFLFWFLVLIVTFLLRSDLHDEWQNLRAIHVDIDSRFERALIGFIVLSLTFAFLMTLTPTLGWDAQMYHLPEAKLALTQGRITLPPDIPAFNYPSFMEMLYLAAMLLKDDGATAAIHLGTLVLTVGAMISFAQRFFSARVGWLASAILIAVPSYLLVASWPYADVAVGGYAFLTVYAIVVAQEKDETPWLVIAGVCAGMAMGIKYIALDLPFVLIVMLFLTRRVSFKRWLWVFVPCVLVAAPWYVRNWVWMGNPVYPFFFGGRYWDSLRASLFGVFGSGLMTQPWRIVIAPWEATVLGEEGKAIYEATIGPLLLAVLPLLVLVWRDKDASPSTRNAQRNALVFVAILYLFWLAGMTVSRAFIQSRYFFSAFPALSLLAAVALDRLPKFDLPQLSLARFMRLWLGVVLGFTLFAQFLNLIPLKPLPYLLGMESRDEFLAKRLTPTGYWQALKSLERFPNARVLLLWEPRSYYAPDHVSILPDQILDRFAHLRNQYMDAQAIFNALKTEGYQYIVLNRWGLEFQLADQLSGLSVNDVRILKELLSRYAHQVNGIHPFDYSVEPDGKVRILNSNDEPYAVYALKP